MQQPSACYKLPPKQLHSSRACLGLKLGSAAGTGTSQLAALVQMWGTLLTSPSPPAAPPARPPQACAWAGPWLPVRGQQALMAGAALAAARGLMAPPPAPAAPRPAAPLACPVVGVVQQHQQPPWVEVLRIQVLVDNKMHMQQSTVLQARHGQQCALQHTRQCAPQTPSPGRPHQYRQTDQWAAPSQH